MIGAKVSQFGAGGKGLRVRVYAAKKARIAAFTAAASP